MVEPSAKPPHGRRQSGPNETASEASPNGFGVGRASLAALLCLALLNGLASVGNPPGTIEDDAVQILLARSIRRGAFALPDAAGTPATDPLPGLAALLALPVSVVEPRWGLLRAIEIACAVAASYWTWRLASGFLNPGAALAAAALTAACPALLRQAGLVDPEAPLLALTLAVLLGFRRAGTGRTPSRLLPAVAGGAAAASLLRPEGALLPVCLALGSWPESGARRAAAFLAASLAPLGLWLLRDLRVARTTTGYALHWRAQVAALGDPAAQLRHAERLIERFFADGLLGLDGAAPPWKLVAGAAVVLAAALGARRLWRAHPRSPVLFVLSAYPFLVLALHMTWLAAQPRYVVAIAPFVWIPAVAGVEDIFRRRTGLRLALAAAALPILAGDLRIVAESLRRPARFQEQTMRWLRENTTPSAAVQSLEFNTVALLARRRASLPSVDSRDASQWLAAARASGADYLHVDDAFAAGGYLPPRAAFVAANLGRWALESPGVRLVYENRKEATRIFALKTTAAFGAAPPREEFASPPGPPDARGTAPPR